MSGSGAFGRLRRAGVAVAIALLAAGSLWWGQGAVRAQAPPPQAQFGYVVLYQGWNLISTANEADISFASGLLPDTLFALPPGAAGYKSTPLNGIQTGAGYWANVPNGGQIVYDLSDVDSATVHLAANSCTLLGNPSTKGSARVTGADSVYTFSPLLNQYIPQSLVGIGQGALACNGDHDSSVSIAFVGDVETASWPNCCNPTPISNGGKVQLIFRNDSPAPITVAFRNMDDQGNINNDNPVRITGEIEACNTCPEYAPTDHNAQGCSGSATTYSFSEPPGNYHLVIQSDDPNVPELISDVAVSGDTKYTLCYFIDATRPAKALWPGS